MYQKSSAKDATVHPRSSLLYPPDPWDVLQGDLDSWDRFAVKLEKPANWYLVHLDETPRGVWLSGSVWQPVMWKSVVSGRGWCGWIGHKNVRFYCNLYVKSIVWLNSLSATIESESFHMNNKKIIIIIRDLLWCWKAQRSYDVLLIVTRDNNTLLYQWQMTYSIVTWLVDFLQNSNCPKSLNKGELNPIC